MSAPVHNQQEHSETADPRTEPGCLPGTPQRRPVPLADAIAEWAAQQDPRHLPPGWSAEAGRGAPRRAEP